MPPKAPGKPYREGITLMELAEMFPDEESTLKWFEDRFWPHGRICGHCGSANICEASHKTIPYWCTCRSHSASRPARCRVHAVAAPQVGLRHPSACDQPEGHLEPETASGDRGFAAGGLVHAAVHPQGLRRPRRRQWTLRRSGRGGRVLLRRQAGQHVQRPTQGTDRTRHRRQDGRGLGDRYTGSIRLRSGCPMLNQWCLRHTGLVLGSWWEWQKVNRPQRPTATPWKNPGTARWELHPGR